MYTKEIPFHPSEVENAGSLGRHVQHDPKSLNHPMEATAIDLHNVTHIRHGSVLNQGRVGSCTGNAIAGAINTQPIWKLGNQVLQELDALSIYEEATVIDPFPGSYPPDDTGSSGVAVCQVAKARGLIRGYRWAFNLDTALQGLMRNPLITGINWYEGFDTPDMNGLVKISGQVRGGHEVEEYKYQMVPGTDRLEDLIWCYNSWGTSFGLYGRFCFTVRTYGRLLAEEGDVTEPLRILV